MSRLAVKRSFFVGQYLFVSFFFVAFQWQYGTFRLLMGANQQFRRNKKLQTIILKKPDLINGHFRLLHNLPKCDLKQTAWQLLVCNQNMYPFGVFFLFLCFLPYLNIFTRNTPTNFKFWLLVLILAYIT